MSEMRPQDYLGLQTARAMALHSRDPSTRVGASIIGRDGEVTGGFNQLPKGTGPEVWEVRARKLELVIHAEMAALLATTTFVSRGATLYVTAPPCRRCAVHIVRAGISRVVHHPWTGPDEWLAEMEDAHHILRRAEVAVECMEVESEREPYAWPDSQGSSISRRNVGREPCKARDA